MSCNAASLLKAMDSQLYLIFKVSPPKHSVNDKDRNSDVCVCVCALDREKKTEIERRMRTDEDKKIKNKSGKDGLRGAKANLTEEINRNKSK